MVIACAIELYCLDRGYGQTAYIKDLQLYTDVVHGKAIAPVETTMDFLVTTSH